MRYSLISPTFKRPDEVSEFIASIAKLSYPREAFEVILGDGTPGDALRPIIKRNDLVGNQPGGGVGPPPSLACSS